MEPKVIFEDEDVFVIDKPSGMTVNKADTTKGEETVQDWIERKYEARSMKYEGDTESDFVKRGGMVHRLDKETSGILLIAKNPQSFENLQKQFKERTVKKKYIALVHGEVKPSEGEINVPVGRLPWNRMRFGVVPGGRESVTKYRVIRYLEVGNEKWDLESLKSRSQDIKKSTSRVSNFSLLEVQPQTGRTHQIRVHLKYLGFPIVGDELYAGRKQSREDRKWCPRLFLHASEISFMHPKTRIEMIFKADLPEDLASVLKGNF